MNDPEKSKKKYRYKTRAMKMKFSRELSALRTIIK